MLRYGSFLQAVFDFLIIAWIVFVAIRAINRMKRAEPPVAPVAPPEEIILLREIRDALNHTTAPRQATP